jgi:hypothetical protein
MARVRTYNHSRFDGGMTHNKRDTSDLTKLGLISHLDIYRNHNEMFVMPGYETDSGFDGSATGVKVYDIRAFTAGAFSNNEYIYALGTKSDGTGSKILERDFNDSEWKVPVNAAFAGEGTRNIPSDPFFWNNDNSDFYYPTYGGGNTTVAQHGVTPGGNYSGSWQTWIPSIDITSGVMNRITGFDNVQYILKAGFQNISSLTASAVTQNAKTTLIFPTAIATGDYQIGIGGIIPDAQRSQILLWDSQSLLADQNNNIGINTVQALGIPGGVWTAVSRLARQAYRNNGTEAMIVQVLNGETPEIMYQLPAATSTNILIKDFNDTYNKAMTWYGRIPTNTAGTEFVEGIWAFGKGNINGQYGVSLLFDTTTLGLVEQAKIFGSVSRLDNFETGTYDVPATIETLIYGADSPYQKELQGVSIVTENLPTGGSVVCSYRTDEESTWTVMGISDTVGKQRHSFTKANGTPIGKFQEIQFKFVITGKTSVKNIRVDIIETSDLPY